MGRFNLPPGTGCGMEYVTAQGVEVPKIGFGTARMRGEQCMDAVESALELGYRHLDTAQMYQNEEAVGAAVSASDVPREEVFVTTKLDRPNVSRERVFSSVGESLERLGTDYVDLLLIHAPSRSVPISETIGAMDNLVEEGRVRNVGVSNFSVAEALEASRAGILTNQVEYNPFHGQPELLEFCVENDVVLTAYSPLDVGRVRGNEVLREIGRRYGKAEAQVALRWLVQQPRVVAIPKASSREHQRQNLDVFDFELSGGEMARIFELQGGLVHGLRDVLGI